MKVLNIHTREIESEVGKIVDLLSTLSTNEDRIWPKEKWPSMKLNDGLKIGSEGGHGPIRYKVIDYNPESHVVFQFQKPLGFNGIHKFELSQMDKNNTQIEHTIEMTTNGIGTIKWLLAIKWLHDTLIEDAFDKIQNQLEHKNHKTDWNIWVKLLRAIMTPRKSGK